MSVNIVIFEPNKTFLFPLFCTIKWNLDNQVEIQIVEILRTLAIYHQPIRKIVALIHRKCPIQTILPKFLTNFPINFSRTRPTLKPSKTVVANAVEFVDIYRNPPTRPDPLYPQPVPDKTAAKCRKDVCLLPDCYCGGKDIPGNWSLYFIGNFFL